MEKGFPFNLTVCIGCLPYLCSVVLMKDAMLRAQHIKTLVHIRTFSYVLAF